MWTVGSDKVHGISTTRELYEAALALRCDSEIISLSMNIPRIALGRRPPDHLCSHEQYYEDTDILSGGEAYFVGGAGSGDDLFENGLVIMPTPETAFYFSALAEGRCICGLEAPEEVYDTEFTLKLAAGCTSSITLDELRDLAQSKPDSPICFLPAEVLGEVPVKVAFRILYEITPDWQQPLWALTMYRPLRWLRYVPPFTWLWKFSTKHGDILLTLSPEQFRAVVL